MRNKVNEQAGLKIEVRKIRKEELPQLLSLYRHLHQEDDELKADEWSHPWQKIMDSEYFHYFVIEIEGILLAACNLSIIPNLTQGGRPIRLIENVVTHAQYRRKGIGRKILLHAIEYARNLNCYKLMLLSNKERKEAHHFYSSLGFRSDSKTGFEIKF